MVLMMTAFSVIMFVQMEEFIFSYFLKKSDVYMRFHKNIDFFKVFHGLMYCNLLQYVAVLKCPIFFKESNIIDVGEKV